MPEPGDDLLIRLTRRPPTSNLGQRPKCHAAALRAGDDEMNDSLHVEAAGNRATRRTVVPTW